MERFDPAARLLERSLELSPDLWPAKAASYNAWCYRCALLLASYGHAGLKDDARDLRESLPDYFSSMTVGGELPLWPFKEPGDAERLAEGLRRAGLPG